jgi:hemoglobin-like flavoprotein
MSENFQDLLARAKSLSGLTPEHEACLKEIAPIITPHLPKITDAFYVRLITSPVTSVFLTKYEDKLDYLKETHLTWLKSLFTLDINAEFAKSMKRVGDVHVEIQLPLDFMTGAMSLINTGLIKIVIAEFENDKEKALNALLAVNAVTALVLVIMQQSYQLFD